MNRFMITVLVVLMFAGVCVGQDANEEEATLRFDLMSAPVKFAFDGEQSFFSTPAIVGIATDVRLFGLGVTPGLYASVELGDDSEDNKLGLVFNVKVFKAFGAGLYWEYWQAGSDNGFAKPAKSNAGFTLSMDIDL